MRKALFLVVSMVTLACVSPAPAQQLVDQVLAVVEDDAIFQSEVDQLVKQFLFQQGQTNVPDAKRAELEKQALDELIKNKLPLFSG